MKLARLLAFFLAAGVCPAQTNAPSHAVPVDSTPSSAASSAAKPAAPKKARPQATAAQLQTALDQLTQSNRDLLDLLKQQQGVLEDIQFDRRLQSRQIESLEERLASTLLINTSLQKQIAALEATAAARGIAPPPATAEANPAPMASEPPPAATNAPPIAPAPAVVASAENPPPASYLPPPDIAGMPGTKSWHRLFTLNGADNRQTDLFHIEGRTWRVIWHNQDQPGKVYVNTSALFISAFPRDDTIPQKVCAKLGSGGDKTELQGPGNYYLKIEGSGGSWELAVEDFR